MITLSMLRATKDRGRLGRIDFFMEKLKGGDFVSVVEIKATDWDAVKPANRRKLLGAHARQVLKYVDKFLFDENTNVCAGMIYPRTPLTPGLKEHVEEYLNDESLQVLWYHDP